MFPIYLFDGMFRFQNWLEIFEALFTLTFWLFSVISGTRFLIKSRKLKLLGLIPITLPFITGMLLFGYFLAPNGTDDLWAWRFQRIQQNLIPSVAIILLVVITLILPFLMWAIIRKPKKKRKNLSVT